MHYQRVLLHGEAGSAGRIRGVRGEGWVTKAGYKTRGDKFEHVTIAERAIGKQLPRGAVVHHVDEDPANNTPSNLVICPSQAYHLLLHQRQRALEASGHADWRKCPFCKQHDDPNLMQFQGKGGYRHARCQAAYDKQRRANKEV